MKTLSAHRATTAHLQAIYPFVSGGGLGSTGPLVGRDLLGGAFCFDPWHLYRTGVLTNPNVVVLGQLGRGKSTFIKTFAWRQIAFGRRAWVLDPKGEYGALAETCGTRPLKLAPGGEVRLNPLELPGAPGTPGATAAGGGRDHDAAVRTRTDLAGSLVMSSLGRPLTPSERTALELAVRAAARRVEPPALSDVVTALLEPAADLAAGLGTDAVGLAADGRPVALELRRLVDGDLSGLFDGRTSAPVDPSAPFVSLDLSAVFASPALPLLMTCAIAWQRAAMATDDGAKRLIVVDEAWALLHDLATARWLQATFKLSRALGVCNLAVVHRLSDLEAAGAAGSAQRHLAEGLLADSETRVIFGQSPAEAECSRVLLGLTGAERDLVCHLPRGVALWKVGDRSFLVEHVVGRTERGLVDTDAAMRDENGADDAS